MDGLSGYPYFFFFSPYLSTFFKLSNTCPCQLQRHFAFALIPSHVPLVAGKRHDNSSPATGLLVQGRCLIDRPLLKIYPNLSKFIRTYEFIAFFRV